MSNAEKPLLGVLGGMGPLATAQFLIELTSLARAQRDQDHCRTLIYSNPGIPDRSDALVAGGRSPLPAMLAGVDVLRSCRVQAIAIPCNTAHFWLEELASSADVPIISIIEAVIADLGRHGSRNGAIGLLGTPGLIRSHIYQAGLTSKGYRSLAPDDDQMTASVEPAIRAVKAGEMAHARACLRPTVEALKERGADAIVLACTELPFAMEDHSCSPGFTVINSNRSLARACLLWADGALEGSSSRGALVVDGSKGAER